MFKAYVILPISLSKFSSSSMATCEIRTLALQCTYLLSLVFYEWFAMASKWSISKKIYFIICKEQHNEKIMKFLYGMNECQLIQR